MLNSQTNKTHFFLFLNFFPKQYTLKLLRANEQRHLSVIIGLLTWHYIKHNYSPIMLYNKTLD